MPLFGKDNPQYKYNLEEYRTFKWLYQKYVVEELSLSAIAKIVGVDIKCIVKWMDKVNIPRRQCGARIGKHNHHFKGSHINTQGYKLIYQPNHPNCDSKKCVREHTLVVEKAIGRYLLPSETTHHIDGNKLNNKPNNLYLFITPNEHNSYHMNPKSIPITKSNLSNF